MHAYLRRTASALLLLAVSACAGNGRSGTASSPSAEEAAERTTVRVENQAWSQAVIYVMHLSQRVRLGEVNGNSTRTFTIPSDVVGAVQSVTFLADPIGSRRTARSFQMQIRRGEEITLTIPASAF
jgi:hypothetical protein